MILLQESHTCIQTFFKFTIIEKTDRMDVSESSQQFIGR